MKTKLRNYLYYHWWFYVISVVLVVVLWVAVFSKLAEPKDNEQINITYIGNSFDNIKLQNDIKEFLPERSKQSIKRITVENAVIDGEYDLNSILRSRTSGKFDFFIIENSIIEEYELNLSSYFPELESQIITQYFGNIELVTENEKVYGLACNNEMKISDYYSGKSACRIFFNKYSVNMSAIFGGSEEQDAAFQVIKYLTEVKDV